MSGGCEQKILKFNKKKRKIFTSSNKKKIQEINFEGKKIKCKWKIECLVQK